MLKTTLPDTIRKVISEVTMRPKNEVDCFADDADLFNEYGLTSIEVMEIVVRLEQICGHNTVPEDLLLERVGSINGLSKVFSPQTSID